MATRWTFNTRHLSVVLTTTRVHNYKYDGDDEDGSTQKALDDGEMVAFDSVVAVWLKDDVKTTENAIGWDHLGSSVYYADRVSEFWTAHRAADPMERNCSIMRRRYMATTGDFPPTICHYFPSMVREACKMAREELQERLKGMPKVRNT